MSKKSISVTLDETTIVLLKTLADKEMRSISNLIDYIVAQYAKMPDAAVYDKWEHAAAFARSVPIGSFSETEAALRKNVRLNEADRAKQKSIGKTAL